MGSIGRGIVRIYRRGSDEITETVAMYDFDICGE